MKVRVFFVVWCALLAGCNFEMSTFDSGRLEVHTLVDGYLQAVAHAHEAAAAAHFAEAQKSIDAALRAEPNDPSALNLRAEVSKKEEAWRAEQSIALAQQIASAPWLDFNSVVSGCTETKQVEYTVDLKDGYYQDYVTQGGKKDKICRDRPPYREADENGLLIQLRALCS